MKLQLRSTLSGALRYLQDICVPSCCRRYNVKYGKEERRTRKENYRRLLTVLNLLVTRHDSCNGSPMGQADVGTYQDCSSWLFGLRCAELCCRSEVVARCGASATWSGVGKCRMKNCYFMNQSDSSRSEAGDSRRHILVHTISCTCTSFSHLPCGYRPSQVDVPV